METINETKQTLKKLTSKKGIVDFLVEDSGLPREQVQQIFETGAPWPLEKDTPEFTYVATCRQYKLELRKRIEPALVFTALADVLQWDPGIKDQLVKDLVTARKTGGDWGYVSDLQFSLTGQKYIRRVARQTGEEPGKVEEVFKGELLRIQRLFDCLEKIMSPNVEEVAQRT